MMQLIIGFAVGFVICYLWQGNAFMRRFDKMDEANRQFGKLLLKTFRAHGYTDVADEVERRMGREG